MRKKSKTTLPTAKELKELWMKIGALRGPLAHSEFKDLVLGLLYLRALSHVESSYSPWRYLLESPVEEMTVRFSSVMRQSFDADRGEFAADLSKIPVAPVQFQRLITLLDGWLVTASDGSTYAAELFRYCFETFSQAEHKTSSEQYSPAWLGRLLFRLLQPVNGLLYDPCCGSGGLLIQTWYETQRETGGLPTVKFLGHEASLNAWRIAQMNLTIHGIPGRERIRRMDSMRVDALPDARANYILANPPFNQENWRDGAVQRQPWQHGEPPAHNGNFAWIQHMVQQLAPHGYAAFTMSNGALTSALCGEGDIRRRLIQADLIDCIISLPGNLFPSSRNPACLWILAQNKGMARVPEDAACERHRKILFIDAQQMGHMYDRVHRILEDEEINRIARTYRAWRNRGGPEYTDISGFCQVCDIQQVEAQDFVLSPARYVGIPREVIRPEVSLANIEALTRKLEEQFQESNRLEQLIRDRMSLSVH